VDIRQESREENRSPIEMWIYRRMGKIIWSEKKTNNKVLKQLKLKRELLNTVRKRQIKFFGHIRKTQLHFESYILKRKK
jgi:ribonucleotide reductase beta subunit family protein with ferritin-like domain